jgi:hypothetical protein
MTYETLKAGDTRENKDETRHLDVSSQGFDCRGSITSTHWSYASYRFRGEVRIPQPGNWTPTGLIGHKILQSDLMTHEFRRPIV